MIKRIKSLISVKNLSASQFADILGVQRSNISHLLSGRNKPSLDFVLKILENFPEVSVEWLINGKGEMYKGIEKPKINAQLEILAPDEKKNTRNEEVKEEVNENEMGEALSPVDEINKSVSFETKDQANAPQESVTEPLYSNEIEQIMILYKNGSFKTYHPQK